MLTTLGILGLLWIASGAFMWMELRKTSFFERPQDHRNTSAATAEKAPVPSAS
ncbi:hypothetical protein OpiT1DRAFT_02929 [Opitutaceae bacterium TAV1]|nr:hypothetical protein OPIT5_11675 [Opitutaceae bacterium TAV5]EIP98472.1 hypothetical protein OpiT1DRAFT_02929 [Opitutaceae bacterium TAV1]